MMRSHWMALILFAAISTAAAAPITTERALTDYLAQHEGQSTPLDALPAGARARFLSQIHFEQDRAYPQLSDVILLQREQAKGILALFGLAALAENPGMQWAQKPLDVPSGISDFEARYNAYVLGTPTTSMEATFPELVKPDSLRQLSSYELLLLLRLLQQTQFEQQQAEHVDAVLAASEELQHRGELPDYLRSLPRDTLLLARRFDDAQQFAAASPDGPVTRFDNHLAGGGAAVWQQQAATGVWQPQTIDLASTRILVLAGCHISEDAVTTIENDPVLGPTFAQHARWLAAPPGIENMQAVQQWNQRHPTQPMLPIHDRRQWKMLPAGWDMPTFLVIRDGQVIDQLKGWYAEGSTPREALLAMLRRDGLLPNATEPSLR